jgi:hypothetical protein
MSAAVQLGLFGEPSPNPHEPSRTVATYPQRPGFKSYGASQEAAAHVAGTASRLRAMVLEELRLWPAGCTADELAKLLQRDRLSIRPRLSELKAAGKIVATGERRHNESGMSASVWRVVTP